MDFTTRTDGHGRKVMAERTWTPELGNHSKVQLTEDVHGHQFVMVSIPGLSLDTMVEWSTHGLDHEAAEAEYQARLDWTNQAYAGVE